MIAYHNYHNCTIISTGNSIRIIMNRLTNPPKKKTVNFSVPTAWLNNKISVRWAIRFLLGEHLNSSPISSNISLIFRLIGSWSLDMTGSLSKHVSGCCIVRLVKINVVACKTTNCDIHPLQKNLKCLLIWKLHSFCRYVCVKKMEIKFLGPEKNTLTGTGIF